MAERVFNAAVHKPTGKISLKSIHQQGLSEIPNRKTISTLKKADKDKDIIGPFDSVEEMMRSLNA